MEKKHYILIGAILLVAALLILVNTINFEGKEKEISFSLKNSEIEAVQRNVQSSNTNSIGEVYRPVKSCS